MAVPPDSRQPPATLRPCEDADIAAVAAIYAHHVLRSVATFEVDPPPPAEMLRRREQVRRLGLPYLVAVIDERVVGYGYASLFRERAAYCHTAEDSIYLHPDYLGRGIGRMLLTRLIADCEAADFAQMVAVIGGSDNDRSVRLHRSLGFHDAGVLRAVGYKFQRWVDVVLMQRPLTKPTQPSECSGNLTRS